MNFYRRLREILVLLVGLYVVGTVGFAILEDWSLFEAFYMTVVTLGTVGYGDFTPKTTGGRLFTIGLIIVGIGTFTYILTTFTTFWIEFRVFEKLERRRMDKTIAGLRDHIILCGAGDSALHIMRELRQTRTPFVVVDNDPGRIDRLRQTGRRSALRHRRRRRLRRPRPGRHRPRPRAHRLPAERPRQPLRRSSRPASSTRPCASSPASSTTTPAPR